MGRRKIEIKAIKDDRNRSVTFLKRKGGLFKKAHELSVLCSVDVAVIIFGNNKKLYEYSSSDIGEILQRYNYYGGANEHKGPADFNGKKDLDDDDDEDNDGGSPQSQEAPMMPPQFQNQPGFPHIRHQAPSASPPIPNGAQYSHMRAHTPQPSMGSRPSSRNDLRRTSLASQHINPGPPPTNGYAYMPQPAIYAPQNTPGMQHHGLPSSLPPSAPAFQFPGPSPQQHIQQVYMEEQRRASMPPAFPQQERQAPIAPSVTPEPPQQHMQPPQQQAQPVRRSPPQIPAQQHEEPEPPQMLQPVKRLSVKSRSIFTPIDESRSILSQHWSTSTSAAETSKQETGHGNRSHSIDVGSVARQNMNAAAAAPSLARPQANEVPNGTPASSHDNFTPPSRTNSAQLGAKRPRLKVQIPDEPSDGGSATAGSSPPVSTDASGANPSRAAHSDGSHSSGVVLPPPSPSASALLSAGASGPPNPFARPHPPTQTSQSSTDKERGNNIDTPVSALPSRFMNNEFLPSPSSFFYPDWNVRGGDSNTLPSPLNFATPVIGFGPSFLREDSGNNGGGKRKTPEAEEAGDPKRIKRE